MKSLSVSTFKCMSSTNELDYKSVVFGSSFRLTDLLKEIAQETMFVKMVFRSD